MRHNFLNICIVHTLNIRYTYIDKHNKENKEITLKV